jgi:hypothetical protein
MDKNFKRCAGLLLKDHYLMIGWQLSIEEIQDADDELTELRKSLDDKQRDMLNGISSDLN